MSYPPKPLDTIGDWCVYNQVLKQRGSLTVRLDAKIEWDAKPLGKCRRQQVYSHAAIQACLSLKAIFGL